MSARKCFICNCSFRGRSDAKTCSARCRKRLQLIRDELSGRPAYSSRKTAAMAVAPGVSVSMPAPRRPKQDGYIRKAVVLIIFGLLGFLSLVLPAQRTATALTPANNLNFQARLLNAAGAVVPDGNYNIDFKIYNADSTTGTVGTCTGACLWEETRTGGNQVSVVNGYFSVNLGSVTSFPSTINWDQQLYLTMNIGGTGSPSWDGEMQNGGHSIQLTSVPLAFRANQLAVAGTNEQILQFANNTFGQATTISLPDPGASTATICYQNAGACGFAASSGSGSYIQNSASLQSSANFNIDGTGKAGTSFLAPSFDAQSSNSALGLGNTNAGAITIGNTTNTTVAVKTKSSTAAFQVQNASGDSVLTVDTSANQTTLGKASTINGTLVFANNAGSNTISVVAQAVNPTSSVVIQLPTIGASGAGQCVLSDTGSTTTNSLLKFSTCPAGSTSQTKVVAMGSPSGCTGSVPVASQDTNADYVVNSCTSAQTTINTAISAISSTGGTVYLKEGTYIVDGQINLAANVKLMGTGTGTILKLKDGINADINLINGASISNIAVQNLILDGNRTNNTAGNQLGVNISSSGSGSGSSAVVGYTLDTITVKNFRGSGLNLSGSNDYIKNLSAINNGGYGIGFTGTTNVNITNSDIAGNGSQGIDCFGIVNSTITGSMFQGNGSEGGIKLATGTGNTISGNTFISNSGAGIKVLSTGNTVTGNTFTSNGGDGVYIQASHNTVTGNTANSNTGNGIEVFSSAVSVTGNRAVSNSNDGILIAGANNQISANNSSNNSGFGIEINGNGNDVDGNTVTSNTSDGVRLDFGTNQNIVSGNQINSNGGNGIMLDVSSQNQLTNNRIHNNGGDGIQISAGCCGAPDKNSITDNNITDTAGATFAIDIFGTPTPTNTYIANNIYSGTGASSIHDTSSSTIYANQLTSTGGFLEKVGADSSTAFQVQNASSTAILTIDSGNDYVKIGSTTPDTVAVLQILDSYNNASDPTGVNGAMYYNTSLNAFRCFQNSIWVNCAGSGAGTLSSSYNAGSTSADQTLNLTNGHGGGVILKDNSTPITGSLFSIQNNTGAKFLDVSSSAITVGENTVANATATGTTATTSGIGTNTTTVALTATNSLANGDVIFIDNAGQDYYTRITAGGGTTSLTVDPAVTYENARTVTKYNVQYLGSDGTNFSGATRNQNSFYQGYFLGGVVTGAGSTVYSDANIQSAGNLRINTASGVNIQGTDSTSAFVIQNAAGDTTLLSVDSLNKAVSISGAGDAAAVLNVTASGPVNSYGFEAGTIFPFTSSSPSWFTTSAFAHSGTLSARSAVIGNSSSTSMSLAKTLTSSGTLSFWFLQSSESADNTTFRIDGVSQGNMTNDGTWHQYSYAVSAGAHTFSWTYVKDGSFGLNQDAGFLDDVLLTLNGSGTGVAATFQSGNVGIGTSGPTQTLEVDGTGLFKSSTNSASAFQVQNASGSNALSVDTGTNTNIVSNGSIETGTSGWAALGSASLAQSLAQQYVGSGSLNVSTTALANDGAKYNLTTTTLASNTKYTLSLEARLNPGQSMSTLEIGRSENGAAFTSCLTAQSMNGNGWANFTCTFTTGSTSNTPFIYIRQTDAVARNIYIDAIQLTRFSLLTNASIEQAIAGNWAVKGSAAVTQDATQFSDGTKSLKVVTTAANNDGALHPITLSNSTFYTLSFRALNTGAAFATMEAGYSSDGSTDNTRCMTAQTVGSSWSSFTCTFATPSTNSGTPYIYIKQTDNVVHTFYVDAVQLVQGSPVSSYREGIISLNDVIGSPAIFQNQADSTNALQIQNSAGINVVSVDTISKLLNVAGGATYNTTSYGVGSGFSGHVDYGTGTTPKKMAVADFNNDGKKDLAVPNSGSATISLLLGNGDGTFATKVDSATLSSPGAATAADFNGDGNQDIAVIYTGSLSIFLGNGDGTFAGRADYSCSSGLNNLIAADFNGDGKPDIAATTGSNDNMPVFMNNGNGTFAACVGNSTSVGANSLSAGDFDGDGDIDVAVAATSNINVFMNNGSGTFTRTIYADGSGPGSMTVAELNGDNRPDIMVTHGNNVGVYLNNGDGTFPASGTNYATGTGPNSIYAADLNGDSVLDIATSNNSATTLSVLINSGTGTFGAKTDYGTGTSPYGVVAADFNGDGTKDLAVSDQTAATVSILLNGATPTITSHNGTIALTTSSASTTGLIIQGSASQTDDLLRLQDPSASPLLQVTSAGVLKVNTIDSVSGGLNVGVNGTTLSITLQANTTVASHKSFSALGSALFQDSTNSSTAFQVQNATGVSLLTVDTTNSRTVLGKSSSSNGALAFANSAGVNLVTLVAQAVNPASSVSISLPTAGATGTQCLSTTSGSTSTNTTLQFANCGAGVPTSQTKVVAMGSPAGCTGSTPVASLDTNADYVVNSCTSAQTTINTAITALGTTGGTVYLKEGTYILDGTINMAANITLAGSGQATVLKLKDGINAGINMITVNASRVAVSNLRLYGNQANNSAGTQDGINVTSSGSGTGASAVPGLSVNNVTIEAFRSLGIFVTTMLNSNISGSTILNNGSHGIQFNGGASTHNQILNNRIQGNAGDGFRNNTATFTDFNGNTVQGNTGIGVNIVAVNNVVSGNSISGNSDGVDVDADDTTVSSNTINNNSSRGIFVNGDARPTITGNSIFSNTAEGIRDTSNSPNGTISGNTIRANSGSGIYCGCTLTNINGNQIVGNAVNGLQIDTSGADGNTVNNNRFYDNGGSGANDSIQITNGADSNQVTNNQISDTAGTGFAIDIKAVGTPTGNYLSGNTYSGTGATAISDSGTGTIYANQRSSTGGIINRVGSDITSSFQIQNAAGTTFFQADSTNRYIGINNSVPAAALDVVASTSSFVNGFESGTLAPFTATNGMTIGTSLPRTGTYSAQDTVDWTGTLSLVQTLSAPGNISFWMDVGCGAEFDVDGVSSIGSPAQGGYTQFTVGVSAGTHTFTWKALQGPCAVSHSWWMDDVVITNVSAVNAAVFNGGNVGIGTSFPNASLEVDGTGLFKSVTNGNNAFQVQNAGGTQLLNINSLTSNLVTNPSIEQAITGNWTTKGTGATVAQSLLQQYVGNDSLSVTTTGTANAGTAESLTLSANSTYTLSLYAKAYGGSSISTINIGRQDQSGTDLDCLTGQTITNSYWTKLSCTFTTGGTISSSNIYVKDTGTNHVFFVDAVQLTAFSLLANPSIESAIAGNWTAYGSPTTFQKTASQHYDAANALQIVETASTGQGAQQAKTLSNSSTYYLTFYAMAGSAFSTLNVGYSSTGAAGGEVDCLTGMTVNTSWTQYNCTFTTPGFNSGSPYIYFKDTGASHTWYIDAVQLTAGPPVVSYPSGAPAAGSFFINPSSVYQDSGIELNGVIQSPLLMQNMSNSKNAVQIQDASGASVLAVDTVNKALAVAGGATYNTVSYSAGSGFASHVDYTVGSGPSIPAVADFNGDTKKDLAVPNGGSGTVSILLGNGDGTFGAKSDISVGGSPKQVITADFNGDGNQDLGVANNTGCCSNYFQVLLGNGDGTFAAATSYTVNADDAIQAGDFNGDNKPDIAVANTANDNILIYMNSGTGTFTNTNNYSTGSRPLHLTIADFNGDTKLDIVTENNSSNTASFFAGNGDGTFLAKVDTGTASNSYDIVHADFNGDSKQDIAMESNINNNVSVQFGNGDGTFGSVATYTTGGNAPQAIATADFTGDGKADLAVTNQSGGVVQVFNNTGTGTFSAFTSYTVGTSPFGLAAGDFNGDTTQDIAASNNGTTTESILLNGATPTTTVHNGTISVSTSSASTTGLILQASASQIDDLMRIQDSSGNAYLEVSSAGLLKVNTLDSISGNITIGSTSSAVILGNNTRVSAHNSFSALGAALFQNATNSATSFQIQNSSGVNMFVVDTSNSKITLGSASATPVVLVLGNKNTSGDPTCTSGGMYYNSNTNQFRICQNGIWTTLGNGLFTSNIDQPTVSNTAAETAFAPTPAGGQSYTLPANYCVPGRIIHVKASGYVSSSSADSFRTRLRLDSTAGQLLADDSGYPTSATARQWGLDITITCMTTGTSGTANVQGTYYTNGDSYSNVNFFTGNTSGNITLNTTVSHAIVVTGDWNTANPGYTGTLSQYIITTDGP